MDSNHEYHQVLEVVRKIEGSLHSGNFITPGCINNITFFHAPLEYFIDDKYLSH